MLGTIRKGRKWPFRKCKINGGSSLKQESFPLLENGKVEKIDVCSRFTPNFNVVKHPRARLFGTARKPIKWAFQKCKKRGGSPLKQKSFTLSESLDVENFGREQQSFIDFNVAIHCWAKVFGTV